MQNRCVHAYRLGTDHFLCTGFFHPNILFWTCSDLNCEILSSFALLAEPILFNQCDWYDGTFAVSGDTWLKSRVDFPQSLQSIRTIVVGT